MRNWTLLPMSWWRVEVEHVEDAADDVRGEIVRNAVVVRVHEEVDALADVLRRRRDPAVVHPKAVLRKWVTRKSARLAGREDPNLKIRKWGQGGPGSLRKWGAWRVPGGRNKAVKRPETPGNEKKGSNFI